MINCPICNVGLLNPSEDGLSIRCNNDMCRTVWELTKHKDFVNTDNREEINEFDKPLKNNITSNIELPKISARTLVLLCIYDWEEKNGEGIMFNELVEFMDKNYSMARTMVSKCQDSLWDIHLIDDRMRLKDGMWAKVIFIEPDAKLFIKKIANELNWRKIV